MDSEENKISHLEQSLRSWLATQLPHHSSTLNDFNVSIYDVLKNGIILCEMMNVIKPNGIKKISTLKTAYKQLENIQNYLHMCKIMGMQPSQLFESADLVNGRFKSSILINLKTLQDIQERYATKSSMTSKPAEVKHGPAPVASAPSVTPTSSSHSNNPLPSDSIQSCTSESFINKHSVSTTSQQSDVQTSNVDDNPASNSDEIAKNVIDTNPEDKTINLIQGWFEALLNTSCPPDQTFFEWIRSGVVLCQVLNTVKPGLIQKIYEGSIGYKQLENVQKYLKACPLVAGIDVPLFSPADLTEERELAVVTSHLHALITIIQRDSKWTGPTLDMVRSKLRRKKNAERRASSIIIQSNDDPSSMSLQVSIEISNPTEFESTTIDESQKLSTEATGEADGEAIELSSETIVEISSDIIPEAQQASNLSPNEELEKARRELEAERQAFLKLKQEALMNQIENERQMKEMKSKFEQEALQRVQEAIQMEKRRSQSIQGLLEEERRARAEISSKLEAETRTRHELEIQKQQVAEEAEKQLYLVAQRLQEETAKRLEALATKLTAEALKKTEIELKKKDEHLLKQIERERLLRSRLEKLEQEKQSLAKTYEARFKSLEAQLEASKANKDKPTELDSSTLDDFKKWNSKWRANKMMTRQLTRTITDLQRDQELVSQFVLPEEGSLDMELTPRCSEIEEDEEEAELSFSDSNPEAELGSEVSSETHEENAQNIHELDKKQWLDDDWSEEEDWEDESEEEAEEDILRQTDFSSEASPKVPARVRGSSKGQSAAVLDSSSHYDDEWSEFSTVNLSKYAR